MKSIYYRRVNDRRQFKPKPPIGLMLIAYLVVLLLAFWMLGEALL